MEAEPFRICKRIDRKKVLKVIGSLFGYFEWLHIFKSTPLADDEVFNYEHSTEKQSKCSHHLAWPMLLFNGQQNW